MNPNRIQLYEIYDKNLVHNLESYRSAVLHCMMESYISLERIIILVSIQMTINDRQGKELPLVYEFGGTNRF